MTKIEWADMTWNPLAGCSRVSEGCRNCYAERMAARLQAMGHPLYQGVVTGHGRDARWTGKINVGDLSHRTFGDKPKRIFVNSMSDLFHRSVKKKWLDDIFAIMEHPDNAHHRFMILTKREERMRDYIHPIEMDGYRHGSENIWIGISVENQDVAMKRLVSFFDFYTTTPLFISAEPLLGPIDLREICPLEDMSLVIVGGESGPGARPMHPAWVRSIRDQCAEARLPFFFKQWGEYRTAEDARLMMGEGNLGKEIEVDGQAFVRIGKRRAGRKLDGQLHDGRIHND